MSKLSLSQAKPNPKNPRKITDKKRQMLEASLRKFGDLSGVVVNRQTGNQIVGGHQRVAAYKQLGADAIVIERSYETPTAAGTVAEGYVLVAGERHAYREVAWSEPIERAANLAANKSAGEFDLPQVAEMLRDLRNWDLELDLSMFDIAERESMLAASGILPLEEQPLEGVQPQKTNVCPSCGHEF